MITALIVLIIICWIFGAIIRPLILNDDKKKLIDDICNVVEKLTRQKFDKEKAETLLNLNIAKELPLPGWLQFLVSNDDKSFIILKRPTLSFSKIHKQLNGKSRNSLELVLKDVNNGKIPLDIKTYCDEGYVKKYSFKDLNKVDIVDKTRVDEQRTYTMEDKSNDAFWGAMVGDMFNSNVFDNYDIAGAIIGASGERKITEDVQKEVHVLFDVIMYLNNLEQPTLTISFNKENRAREFVGILEYIMNNK